MDKEEKSFFLLLSLLLNLQNNGNNENLSKTDALVFMVGNDDDASQYSKSNALQVGVIIISSINSGDRHF